MNNLLCISDAVEKWVLGFTDKAAFLNVELTLYINQLQFFYPEWFGFEPDYIDVTATVTKHLVSKSLVSCPSNLYSIVQAARPNPYAVVTSLYPVGYLSYLSAMRFYNITNRLPKNIDWVVPHKSDWQAALLSVGAYSDMPYPSSEIDIDNKRLIIHSSDDFKVRQNTYGVRVISIGDLFIQMLRNPRPCGGFQHVIETFEWYADDWFDTIIESVQSIGTATDKHRIGFILEVFLEMPDKRISEWKSCNTKEEPYKMTDSSEILGPYNHDWNIQLNHSLF